MIRKAIRFLGSVVSGSPNEEETPCPCLVLLLGTPIELTREAALDLATRAWGDTESRTAIRRASGRGWRVRVSEVQFGLRCGHSRFHRPGQEASLTRQQAWDRHNAWLVVEYPEGARMPESEWPSCYKLLFLMANQLWSENCLGLYLPVQEITIPNMGDMIASIRWAAGNGTPLPFLHEAEERQA
jgi:hypothetical protein